VQHKHIEIVNSSEHWIQTKAVFAMDGIELTDDLAEQAGRLIAGQTNLEQCLQSLMLDRKA